jgi:hypothetical protein
VSLVTRIVQRSRDELFGRGFRPIPALRDKLALDWSWMLSGPVNQRVIRVPAMRRSGHHAILNWIRYHQKGRHFLLNNCKAGENPFLGCSRIDSVVGGKNGEHRYINWDNETKGKFSKKNTLIYNYEDCDLVEVEKDIVDRETQWFGTTESRFDLLILRDPFNLFASMLRWMRGKMFAPDIEELRRLPQLWIQYAKEYLGDSNYLSDKVTVSFNEWFQSRACRDQMALRFGFLNEDRGLQEVAKWGPSTWGDSFDGMKYDGQAQSMKVFDRWRQYAEDREFKQLFMNDELWRFSHEIFGPINGTEQLRST